MKTAKETFNKFKHSYLLDKHNQATPLMDYNNFKQALTEHDAETVKIIDNKIKELKPNKPPDNSTEFFEWRAKIGILTELKEKVK